MNALVPLISKKLGTNPLLANSIANREKGMNLKVHSKLIGTIWMAQKKMAVFKLTKKKIAQIRNKESHK